MSSADWMPGIDHDPGENAGYRAGEADMVSMVIHYTAGAYGGDYAVGKRGYFNFYCPRDRPAVQFAEANAVTFHAGAWNGLGPGIELERRDDSVPYTDHQLSDLGDIARWLHDRYGIPLTFYDTGGDNNRRIGVDESRGLSITHRSLAQQGGWHSDYVTADEWARAIGGAAPAPEPEPIPEDDDVALLITSDPKTGADTILYNGFRWRSVVPGEDQQLADLGIVDEKNARVVDPATMDRIRRTLPSE